MLDADAVRRVCDRAAHRSRCIWLVVERARHPSDQRLRYELAHEDYAALFAAADVETQVQLGKVSKARPWNAENAGIDEVEADQACECLIIP